MSLELKLTKLDETAIADEHLVYLAVDDDAGNNFIRRPLPSVKLSGLSPGKTSEFKEHLLFPGLQPGHYRISLWIPRADPALKFKAEQNLLLSSYGVADQKSRLNAIASFSVAR